MGIGTIMEAGEVLLPAFGESMARTSEGGAKGAHTALNPAPSFPLVVLACARLIWRPFRIHADAPGPIDFGDVLVGPTICEDVWNDKDFWPTRLYHRDPVAELAAQGVDLFINISASPFTIDKADLRRRMIRQAAVTHQRYFLYVNQVGGNDEIVFDGHSIGVAPDGREIVRAAEFGEDFIVCDVPVEAHRERVARAEMPQRDTRRDELLVRRGIHRSVGMKARDLGAARVHRRGPAGG